MKRVLDLVPIVIGVFLLLVLTTASVGLLIFTILFWVVGVKEALAVGIGGVVGLAAGVFILIRPP